MDKCCATARDRFREYANLIAAIRLPQGAMRADAGTDVVVDLLFFQAREPGTAASGPGFLEIAEVLPALDARTPAVAINRYFLDHPAMVLGKHERTTSAFGPVYTCTGPIGPALEAALAERIAGLPTAIHTPPSFPAALSPGEESAGSAGNTDTAGNLREGSYLIVRSRLNQIAGGVPAEVTIRSGKGRGIPRRHAEVIMAMIPIRDTLREILHAQETDRPCREAQFRLRSLYTSFVRSFGAINRTEVVAVSDEETGQVREIVRRPNLAIFADDPDVWLVSSIEEYDPETRTARPGPIFDQRVIRPPAEPVVVTAADALPVSLHECGRVDPETIAELLGRPWEEIEAELAGLIFRDPETGHW
ncbi:MAG: lactate dehydrogenase, partial [Acetobacteraceae bacterium]